MKKKFLILLGTQKSGSTWLSNQLRNSDEYYTGGLKEWRLWRPYFNIHTEIDFQIDIAASDAMTQYLVDLNQPVPQEVKDLARQKIQQNPRAFLNACVSTLKTQTSLRVLADLTPSSGLLEVHQLQDIAALFAKADIETKAILLIRDPLQRALSQARMIIDAKHPEMSGDETALNAWIIANMDKVTRKSRIEGTLKKIVHLDPVIRPKIVFFDDLFSQNALDDICAYLEIDPVSVTLSNPNPTRALPIHDATKEILAKNLRATYEYLNTYFDGAPQRMWPRSYHFLRKLPAG